jgi:hypothetical protein
VGAVALERVLEREAVQDGGEHAGVVGSGPVHALARRLHAAVDVPGADDERRLDAALLHLLDLAGERVHPGGADAVRLVAHERLSGELQEDAAERRAVGGVRADDLPLGLRAHSLPTL